MPYEETLKADLLREGVPEQFKPVKDKGISIITKEFNAHTTAIKSPEIKLVNSSDTTKRKYEPRSSYATPPSRERKDWFIPANDKMRSFGENIEYELMVRGHRVKMPDNSSKGDTGLRGAFQSVATSGKKPPMKPSGKKPEQKLKASAKIPPQYKQEPYKPETPKASKMSRAFYCTAAPPDDNKPSQNPDRDYRP